MIHASINLFLISGILASFLDAEPTAESITRRMQTKLDGVTTLSADFSVVSHLGVLDQTGQSLGRLFIKRDENRLRLEQEGQTVVSDGETVWTFIPDNSQIIVSPMESSGGMRPDEFLFYYSLHYVPELKRSEVIDDVLHYVLELQAEEELAQLDRFTIWVDSEDWLTRKVQYSDDSESTTTIQFTDIRINPKLPDDTFVMEVPPDVEVVDLR